MAPSWKAATLVSSARCSGVREGMVAAWWSSSNNDDHKAFESRQSLDMRHRGREAKKQTTPLQKSMGDSRFYSCVDGNGSGGGRGGEGRA
mmetsp:Transcript_29142/g.86270  ORF Transcript_29142/g.86270 Transcript_29142/m.86270 type:complete len:90 (+) Transcript_29142:997-1266(+)